MKDVRSKLKLRPEPPILDTDYLPTGYTGMDLAISGTAKGGLVKGKYFHWIGDSEAGKTFVALTSLAEASINPNFNDYRLIYDPTEDGALMEIERYFGRRLARRLEPPARRKGRPAHSETIEDFYFNLYDALADGLPPCIYVLDSMDALSSTAEEKKFKQNRKIHARQKDEDPDAKLKGSYGDGKAKANSAGIRTVLHRLKKKKSILIVISQARDDLSGMGQGTNSGGRALRFYAAAQIWFSIAGKIKKEVRGIDRDLGMISRVTVKKNRLTGRHATVSFPIYHSHGIDNVGGCVDFLVKEKEWRKKKGVIDAHDLGVRLRREDLIRYIEDEDAEAQVAQVMERVWNEIARECSVDRKNRYGGIRRD
jgi:RecA/RadA recombinase